MKESDSIVIIPTYNEKENIEKIIRAVFGLEKSFHILIIDDGSPDGTAAIRRLAQARRCRPLWHQTTSKDVPLPDTSASPRRASKTMDPSDATT